MQPRALCQSHERRSAISQRSCSFSTQCGLVLLSLSRVRAEPRICRILAAPVTHTVSRPRLTSHFHYLQAKMRPRAVWDAWYMSNFCGSLTPTGLPAENSFSGGAENFGYDGDANTSRYWDRTMKSRANYLNFTLLRCVFATVDRWQHCWDKCLLSLRHATCLQIERECPSMLKHVRSGRQRQLWLASCYSATNEYQVRVPVAACKRRWTDRNPPKARPHSNLFSLAHRTLMQVGRTWLVRKAG